MAKQKTKYVQLEPAAFITDLDFQMMNAEQRGVYCSLIFYLYCNDGKIELNNNSDITLLDSQTSKLAVISGCLKTGGDWDAVWSKIAHKFNLEGNCLTHPRVTEELERAEEFQRAKSEAGKKGMKKRWGHNSVITKENNSVITKRSEVKRSEVKESKDNKYSQNSDEFRLSSLLFALMVKRKPDYKTPNLQSWAKHIDLMIRVDNRKPEAIEAVIRWCQQADFWQNNILSTSKLRKQFDKLELQMQKGNKNGQKSNSNNRPSLNAQDWGQDLIPT
jgi:uncharacterized protein YdaU (DUF1376 family)